MPKFNSGSAVPEHEHVWAKWENVGIEGGGRYCKICDIDEQTQEQSELATLRAQLAASEAEVARLRAALSGMYSAACMQQVRGIYMDEACAVALVALNGGGQ